MARSHKVHRHWFSRRIEISLLAELGLPGEHLYYRSPSPWRGPGIGEAPASRPAVVAALGRRGWPPRRAWARLLDGSWWHEEEPDADERRYDRRSYRRQAKVLTSQGRADEIGRYPKFGNW
jgi:hypothetical protein